MVGRTFTLAGRISWQYTPPTWTFTNKSATVQFGPGAPTIQATPFTGTTLTWQCTGTVPASIPWGSMVPLTVSARATFRYNLAPGEPATTTLTAATMFMVRLVPAIPPTVTLDPVCLARSWPRRCR